MHRKRISGKIIVPNDIKSLPEDHEVATAQVLAKHYRCVIEFLRPVASYKTKTPDIVMNGIMWEIKSPIGNSKKSTIEYQFKGLKQSRNLIIDGRRTQLGDAFITSQIKLEIARRTRVGRIIFITKSDKVIEF